MMQSTTPDLTSISSTEIYIGHGPTINLGVSPYQDGYSLFGLTGESTDDFGMNYPGTFDDWPREFQGIGSQRRNLVMGVSLLLLVLTGFDGWGLPAQYRPWIAGLALLGLVLAFLSRFFRSPEERQFEERRKQQRYDAGQSDAMTIRLQPYERQGVRQEQQPYRIVRKRGDTPIALRNLPLPPSGTVYVTLLSLTPQEKLLIDQTTSKAINRNTQTLA